MNLGFEDLRKAVKNSQVVPLGQLSLVSKSKQG